MLSKTGSLGCDALFCTEPKIDVILSFTFLKDVAVIGAVKLEKVMIL